MKTLNELLEEKKKAIDAGASSAALQEIEYDILSNLYTGSPEIVDDIRAKEKFRPFQDKRPDEIAFILADRDRMDRDRILYENFSQICNEITDENPDVWFNELTVQRQRALFDQKVEQYRGMIRAERSTDEEGNQQGNV